MKVLFQSRIDLFTRRGGDTVQMERTAEALRRLGVEVKIDCSANPDLSNYDLVHLFNIDWPAQVYLQAKNAKKQGKPVVFSPIHHSYCEIERYEREARYGPRRLVNVIFKARESRERFKDFCRMLVDPRKIPSILVEFRKDILNEQKELLKMADVVLVQTDAEAADIETDFYYSGAPLKSLPLDKAVVAGNSRFRWQKVVNGVEPRFAEAKPDWFVEKYGLRDFILSVGRIEPRKNQLAVIEAVGRLRNPKSKFRNPKQIQNSNNPSPKQNQDISCRTAELSNCQTAQLLFVGKISWRHPEYALRFKTLVQKCPWIYHIPQIPHEKMGSCYAAARIHVLASWFETTGLVNLEAGLSGTNVVAAGKRAREYLLDFASYCDPGNVDSITAAIVEAWEKPFDPGFREHILKNFTWERTAEQTLAAYAAVLSSK